VGSPAVAAPGRALSRELARRRRAAGLTQRQLSDMLGCSETAVGHAETGRLWQAREWWQLADNALNANGRLLHLHDDYRDTRQPPDEPPETGPPENPPPPEQAIVATTDRHAVKSIVITWADGDTTTINILPRNDIPPGISQEQEQRRERA